MKQFITSSIDGSQSGPEITAIDFEHAEQLCPDGFRVDGELFAVIPFRDGFDPDQYLRDFADANSPNGGETP